MTNSTIVIFKTTYAMMKRKKMQSILVGIIIMLISTLLYVGISISNQTNLATVMFERANATESLMIVRDKKSDIDKIITWWKERDEVEDIITYKVLNTNVHYDVEGKEVSDQVAITEYIENSKVDLLYETDKILSQTPVDNEILINYKFAKIRSLELGDIIRFVYDNKEYEFTVAGFIVDAQVSSAFMSFNRCYVKPGFFETNNIVNSHIIGIKYYNIEDVDDYRIYEDFDKNRNKSIIFIDYKTIMSSYTIIINIIASILLGVSFFIFIIVAFVIRSVVRNLILSSYKQIGVKKVLGYTNKQIQKSFLWMYSIIAVVASTIGSFIGILIRNIINEGISHDIQVGLKSSFDINIIITVLIVISLIIIFTSIATKRANAIKPVQAIKYGMPESKVSMNKFNICKSRRMPLSILLAIKQMLGNKKKTITATITITILIYVAFFINSSAYSLADSENFINSLFGMKVGDFIVINDDTKDSAEFIDTLESLESIESAVICEFTFEAYTKEIENDESILVGSVTIYGDYQSNGLKLLGGRQPKDDFEIVVSSKLAEKTGKVIGDYIIIKNEDKESKLFICGTYNTVINDGITYVRIIKKIPEGKTSNNYWVYSNDEHVIINNIEKEISDIVDYEITVNKYDSDMMNVLSTIDLFPMVMKSLLIVFLIISGVIILNLTIMDIVNSTKAFGIMKATGHSSSSITKMMVIKSVFITTIGVILGFCLNLATANLMMQGIFKLAPIQAIELPILFDSIGSIILMILFIVIAIVATLIPARKISKISPKILMNE